MSSRVHVRFANSRLLALSHPEAELSAPLWKRTLELDAEIDRRATEREAKRRETKLGAPTPPKKEDEMIDLE